MEKKTYEIAGLKFNLKTDLELDESIEVSNLMKNLSSESSNTIAGNFSSEDMKKFLSIVLTPADGKELPGSFSFGKIRESVQMEVFKDFFLDRIVKVNNLSEDFAGLIAQQQKL